MAIKCALKKKKTQIPEWDKLENTWRDGSHTHAQRECTRTDSSDHFIAPFLGPTCAVRDRGAAIRVKNKTMRGYPRTSMNSCDPKIVVSAVERRFYAVFKVVMHFLQILLAEPVRAVSAAAAAAYSSTTWGSVRVTVLWDLVHKSIVGSFRGRRVCDVRPCFHQTWYEIDRCTFGPARFQQIRPNFFPFFFFLSPT